jgi:CheY-like chemotaxis protein
LRIEVSDTGPGLDEEERAHIFEPFVQGRARATSRGAGLGLTICRHLVTRMGGAIGVDSVVGDGATFWCELPLPVPVASRATAHVDGDLESDAPAPAREVLLVEDDELTRKVFLLLLRSLGCRVDVAEDGARAVERCAQKRYDLVLMDCQMPVMNGLDATRAIRGGSGPNRDTCIVGLTAGTREAAPAMWGAAGMTTLLHKPLDTRALRALLDTLPVRAVGSQSERATSPGRLSRARLPFHLSHLPPSRPTASSAAASSRLGPVSAASKGGGLSSPK